MERNVVQWMAWLGLACAPVAHAEDPIDVDLLLRDDARLVRWVEGHSPAVKANGHRVAEAVARVGQASVLQNPQLGVDLANIPLGATNPEGLAFKELAVVRVGLSQTFELGKRGPRTDAAQARLEATRWRGKAVLLNEVTRARLALADVVAGELRRRAVEEALSVARGLVGRIEARIAEVRKKRTELEPAASKGRPPKRARRTTDPPVEDDATLTRAEAAAKDDAARAVALVLELEARLASLDGALATARSRCAIVLRAPCAGGGTAAALEQAAPIGTDAHDVRALVASRPDIEALRQDRVAAEQTATLVRRRLWPDPTVTVSYAHSRATIAGDQANTLLVGLSFPIPAIDYGQHDRVRWEQRTAALGAQVDAAIEDGRATARVLTEERSGLERVRERLERLLPKAAALRDAALGRSETSADVLSATRLVVTATLELADTRHRLFEVRNALRVVLGLDRPAKAEAPAAPPPAKLVKEPRD